MTALLAVTAGLLLQSAEPHLPWPPWAEEAVEREEWVVLALACRGLDDLLKDYYMRELDRPGQPRDRRNRLRAGLIELLETLAHRTEDDVARRAFLKEALAVETAFHNDNVPPDRDDNYDVLTARLARTRGERLKSGDSMPGLRPEAGDSRRMRSPDFRNQARKQLQAAVEAVRRFRSLAQDVTLRGGIAPEARRRIRRITVLSQAAETEAALALLALAGLQDDDARARQEALAEAERAFDRALEAAPFSTRRGLDAALGKASLLREVGDLEAALTLIGQVKGADLPGEFLPRVNYELIFTLVRANELAKAIAVADEFLADGWWGDDPADLELRVRVLQLVAVLRQASQQPTVDEVAKGLQLARRMAARGSRYRWEVLDLLGLWHARHPDLGGNDPLVRFAAGDYLFRRQEYPEAAKAFEAFTALPASAERDQLLPDAWFKLGAAYFRAQTYAKAGAAFRRVQSDFPTAPLAPESAYNATVAYENAFLLEPGQDSLKAYLESLRAYIKAFPDHRMVGESRWRLAETLLREARAFDEAARAFAEIPPADPRHWVAMLMVADSHERHLMALLEAGAEKRVEAARQVAPAVEALKHFCALVAATDDWPDEATRAQARGEAAHATMRLAQVFITPAAGAYDQAVDTLAAFEKDYPDQKDLFPRVEALRLQALALADREASAQARLDHILKTFPTDLDTLRALKGAEDRLTEDLAAAGDDGDRARPLQLRLARVYDYLTTWLAAQPGDYRTYTYDYTLKRAQALYKGQDYAQALALLEQLERENPKLGNVLLAMADCYERAGNYDEALERYRRVVKGAEAGSPAWFQAQYDVARMHLKRGRPADGLRLIQVLRQGWPTFGSDEMKARFLILERDLEAASR